MRQPIVLASRSPRRAQLLRAAGIPFDLGPFPDVDERIPADLAPPEAARRLAERKARAVMPRVPGRTVLAADTLVFLPEEVLTKPRDGADAQRMLGCLSGRTHAVATGVAVGRGGALRSAVEVTQVAFRILDASEIAAYVETGEPLDKAGAYGIQGGAAAFVAHVEGGLDTVIGLPVALALRLLQPHP